LIRWSRCRHCAWNCAFVCSHAGVESQKQRASTPKTALHVAQLLDSVCRTLGPGDIVLQQVLFPALKASLGKAVKPTLGAVPVCPSGHLSLAAVGRVCEEMCLYSGACIGYYCGDTRKILEDSVALKPTVFAGVPRVYERVYAGVMDKASKAAARQRHQPMERWPKCTASCRCRDVIVYLCFML